MKVQKLYCPNRRKKAVFKSVFYLIIPYIYIIIKIFIIKLTIFIKK